MSSLTKLFPNYSVKQLERPSECHILLSQANANLMPSKHIVNGDLVMWSGPSGNVVGGSHPDLREEGACNLPGRSTTYKAFSLKAMSGEIRFADPKLNVLEMSDFEIPANEISPCYRCRFSLHSNNKELIQWFRYDPIGAACVPKCGSCRCGYCVPGGKAKILKEERELQQIEKCLTFRPQGDDHSPTRTGMHDIHIW